MSGEAPEGWTSVTLGDVLRLEYGRALSASTREAGGIPVYGSNGICGQHSVPLVPERGIVVGRKGTAGSVTVTSGPFWPIDTTYFVVPRLEVDFGWLASTLTHARLSNLIEATGVPGLNRDKAYLQPILLPPNDEQRRIAEVLRSIDDAIANELALLGQYQAAYDSTMSAFLATGNDSDDGVSTDGWITGRIKAVHRIPNDWRITRLVEVANLESGHTPSRAVESYWEGGDIGWISLHDTKNLERREIWDTALKITAAGVANSSARMLPQGTVCLSRTATVGKCVIMGRRMTTSQDFANFVCSSALNNRYLLHLFRWMGPIWKALSSGSTHKTIYMPTFEALQIIVPAMEAQESVAAALDAIASAIELSSEHLESLRELRRSISSDLLSGRVRVPA
jgi:type I restriction enzyme S subunit